MQRNQRLTQVSSGSAGLDTLLNGGFVKDRLYLIVGEPGTGKTILGSQFLREGLDNDEDVLFIHGEEARADIVANAAALGIDLSDADFLDIGPESAYFGQAHSYDVADPHDVEDESTFDDVRDAVERYDPDRVLIDPITHFQHIERSEYQYHKRIIAFTRFLNDRDATVLATKTRPRTDEADEQLTSLSDGVVELTQEGESHRIRVPKHRGIGKRAGSHGVEIGQGGLTVYPALRPEQQPKSFDPTPLPSGIEGLDALLGGGLEQGTVTIISGPAGVGKSTTATEFLHTAATEGSGAAAYLFEEGLETFVHRSETFGIPITNLREQGALTIEQIESQVFSPEEFARRVTTHVDQQRPDLVVIDGIEGYKSVIKGSTQEVALRRRLHALTEYLTDQNVTVVLIDQRPEITGFSQPTGSDMAYLADNLLFQQYIERDSELQRIAGVLKKRVGEFENTPRRYRITANGISVGEPAADIDGVLEGHPEHADNTPRQSR